VLEGVTVAKTITVQMIPTEPRMADLPSWLDPDNQDDRIIGSLLEIQCAEPSAVVVLVTDDMNLQNKAEMAFLPWAEPPEFAPKPVAVPAT
jgi:predicted ribonuclease YlaK